MRRWLGFVFVALIAVPVAPVRAHFKLLSPASWLKEDSVGGPQKGGPCGPGGADDVQPVPMSMDVTTVHAGDTIDVKIQETIHHPGWFRIALAEDPSTFKDPDFPNTDCTVDMTKVPTGPHDNVLMDGLAMDSSLAGSNRDLTEKLKIPDQPCEKCTLQVIQVMADVVHSPPGCVYHHCAQLKILPAMGSAGASGSSATAGTSGAAGSSAGSAGAAGSTAGSMAGSGGGMAGASGQTVPSAGSGGSAGTGSSAGTSGTTTTAGSRASAPTSSSAGSPASSSGTSTSPLTSGAAGSATPATAAPVPETPAKSGGCSVTRLGRGSHASGVTTGLLASVAFVFAARARRGKRRTRSTTADRK
jgi:hypothetical protein